MATEERRRKDWSFCIAFYWGSLQGMGSKTWTGGASEFHTFGTAVKIESHANLMRTTSGRGQVRNGHIIAVTEFDDVGLDTKGNDKGVTIFCTEDSSVPYSAYNGAFAHVSPNIHLLELSLAAVQDVGRDEGRRIARISIEWEKGTEMSGELHGKTAQTDHQAFIGLVQVVCGKSEVDLFAKTDDACAKVHLADFASSGPILRGVDESFAGINHVSKLQLAPV